MSATLEVKEQIADNLLIAADRLNELGRLQSDFMLLVAGASQAKNKHLRRLLAHAEQNCEIAVARYALRCLVASLQKVKKPAAERELATLRGRDLYLLDVLEGLGSCGSPISPVKGRLLYVLHHSRPYLTNGYATRGHGLAKGMLQAGIDLICLTRPGFPLDVKKELQDAPSEDVIEGVTYIRDLAPKRSGPGRSRTYILDAATVLEERIRMHRPQAVMAASNYVAAIPALIAARRTGVPLAYEVRGFWEVTEASRDPALRGTYANILKTRLETLAARLSDKVFTLSSSMSDELVRRGVPRNQIALLPNSCAPEQFRPLPPNEALSAALQIPPNTPVIGYIGSFVPYEGLDDLTVACGKLRAQGHNFRLILVGAAEGKVFDQVSELGHQYGLSDWMLLPGRVPHEDVEKWYSLIDIAPFPRKPLPVSELVTPIKPLEAMAMKKSVVMSSVAAMADMIHDGHSGLIFKKGDVDDLAAKLRRLVEDPHLRQRLGCNARRLVEAERTWNIMGEKVSEWLRTT